MAKKASWFIMRASPLDNARIDTVAELAEIKNKSESVRLAIGFVLSNSQLFKYWLAQREV